VLRLFSIFHLNLLYSSIEESQRAEVVRRCYWPLLRVAERTGAPIGIEASGVTLEAAAALDPSWLDRLKRLCGDGRCEFVGSGYAQIIGPLVPAAVNAANLRIGHDTYERLLGFRPAIAFVNEQAYSAGLIQHYLDASYQAIVMEWDNPARAHPEWDAELRYFPQRACGQHGETIPLIWNKAIAFQQFQRYAHDESSLEDYLAYLERHQSSVPRALAIYGNDAEIFDFRPGRYLTEPALAADSEWTRIERVFATLIGDPRFELIPPSRVLERMDRPEAAHALHLESAQDPTPVKKQRKYNITRWAVTGRDDLGINTVCWRRYHALASAANGGAPAAGNPAENDWKDLCELWSSDYRTHITDARWSAFQRRVRAASLHHDEGPTEACALTSLTDRDPVVSRDGSFLTVRTRAVTVVLNCRRGLAIQTLAFGDSDVSLCGTLKHGFYDDIHWGADFYSGMTVMESPGRPKTTDLNRVEPVIGRAADGTLVVEALVLTEAGPVVKTIRVAPDTASLELIYRLEWPEIPVGSLRLGDITLNPHAFDRETLFYRSHNGGRLPETFPLHGTRVAHGDAVSFLVSASHAVGVTEGMVEVGDRARSLRIDVDKARAALVAMVTYEPIRDTYFCRVSFSAAEVDETRRPTTLAAGNPLVCRLVLSPG
jgi:Glycosyl hydrolase family 57